MTQKFDLRLNAFVLLRLEPTATNREIHEAFEDASSGPSANESDLATARQGLLIPKQRLQAELSALVDTPPGEARSILVRLCGGPDVSELRRLSSRLAPLSRLNLVTHIAANYGGDPELLTSFVGSVAEVETSSVCATLERVRNAAGFLSADKGSVREALHTLFAQHASSVLAGYERTDIAAADVAQCTVATLSEPDDARLEGLEILLRAYRVVVGAELSRISQDIEAASAELRQSPTNGSALQALSDGLNGWAAYCRPLHLLDARKGRDAGEARTVYEMVRSLCIELANDLKHPDVALTITRLSASVFKELPRASAQLAEDLTTLEQETALAGVGPLVGVVEDLKSSLQELANDLRSTGFAGRARGTAGELLQTLSEVAASVSDTPGAEFPFLIVRDLAIRLNNELQDPSSALVLVNGLLDIASKYDAPRDLIDKLNKDRADLEHGLRERKVLQDIQGGRYSNALSGIDALLRESVTAEESKTLQELQRHVHSRRNAVHTRWAFAGVGVVILFFVFAQDRPSPPRYSPPISSPTTLPAPQTAPPARGNPPAPPPQFPRSEDGAEAKPSIGRELIHSRASIRYCLFQKQRLENARALVVDGVPLANFNQAVSDWNLRCASYRYYAPDLAAVQAELVSKHAMLRAQGRAMVEGWRPRPIASWYDLPDRGPTTNSIPLPPPVASPRTEPAVSVPGPNPPDGFAPSPKTTTALLPPPKQPATPDEMFMRAFGGVWALDQNACPGSRVTATALPVTITATRAQTRTGVCEFAEKSGSGEDWTIRANCRAGQKQWTANIKLIRRGDTLIWSSERGTNEYYRCQGSEG